MAFSLFLSSNICLANSSEITDSNYTLIASATLPELNQSTKEIRTFNFKPNETQTLTENMGVTSSGTFNINGKDKNSNSIIFNQFNGFVVSQIETTLNINNTTLTDAQSPSGAVIYNTIADSNITINNSEFNNNTITSNNDNAFGGAIYNSGNLILKNTSFKSNSATTTASGKKAKGGAIYSTNSVEMIADSDNVVVVDNYTEDSSGKTNNAIYMDNSNAELDISVVNNGKFNLKDNIDGQSGYKVNITGDNSGTFNMEGEINNAEINTSDVTISFVNNKIEDKKVENLHIGDNTYFELDANLDNATADKLIAKNSDGVMRVSNLNILQGTSNDEVKVQVLKESDNVTLNIDKLSSNINHTTKATMYNTDIIANSVSLGTTDTTNDSIIISGWKDTLYEMIHDAEPTHMIKNFIFATDTEYVLTKDLGEMLQESMLTISNESDAEYGTINANGHSMFELSNPVSNVTIKNIHIKNANSATDGSVANLSNTASELTIENSLITDNHSNKNGGAIYDKNGTLEVTNTNFENNSSDGNGGAIAIESKGEANFVNTNFTSNTSNEKGGAIYTKNDLTITAKNDTVTFEGNTAQGKSNAIYVDKQGATVTLKTEGKSTINLNDGIDGTENGYNLNIKGTSKGTVNVNAKITNADIAVSNVRLNLAEENLMTGNDFSIRNGTINLLNNKIGNTDFSSISTSGNTTLYLDADLKNVTMDRITADSYSSINGMFNVRKINLLSDGKNYITTIKFADSPIKSHVKNYVPSVAYSKIYRYLVDYQKESGSFIFNRGDGKSANSFNPAILTGAISNQMTYLSQLQNYHSAMYHSRTYMMLPQKIRSAYIERSTTRYAKGEVGNEYIQSNIAIQEEIKSIWVSPYTSFESIELNKGPKVTALNFGTMFGGDSDMIELGHGFKMVYGGYVGYNGSLYEYRNVNAIQQGAVIGATINLYKGNFFNTFTANVGWMINNSDTEYGSDTINNIVTGFSDRIGYNIEIKSGKFIIQPSLMIGYTFVDSPNFTTSNGVHIESEPLHAIHFEPTLKMICNLSNGWQPYGIISITGNFIDKSTFTAETIAIPQMSVDAYVEYGLGIQKRWDDKFSGFIQATVRGGGRKGASLLFGFRYMIGKIISREHFTLHDNLGKRKTLFKERKEAEIEIDPIRSRSKNRTKPNNQQAGPNMDKKRINLFNGLKKLGRILFMQYQTDVSAKVVTDTYSDGIIITNIKGMNDKAENNARTDFKDKDLITKDYKSNDNNLKNKPAPEKTTNKETRKINEKPVIQNIVKPNEVKQDTKKNITTQKADKQKVENIVKPNEVKQGAKKDTTTQKADKPKVENNIKPNEVKQDAKKNITTQKADKQKVENIVKPNEVKQDAKKNITTQKADKQKVKKIVKPNEVKHDDNNNIDLDDKKAAVERSINQNTIKYTAPKTIQKTIDIKPINIKNKKNMYLNQEKYNEQNEIHTYNDYKTDVIDIEF